MKLKNYLIKQILVLLLLLPIIGVAQQAGELELSYNHIPGANRLVRKIVVQPDGKMLIAGNFTTYNGFSRNYIARINSNGSLDETFDVGTGANNLVYSIALQTDGKIIICGNFTAINGTSINRIARLNSDGSLDVTFNPGTGANNYINQVLLQPDGKILIGGIFTTYNGTARNRITRLNNTGSLDASFDIGTGANNVVHSIGLQSDGKIIVVGEFTIYNRISRNYLIRLNSDGILDASFNSSDLLRGPNSWTTTLAIQSDDKLLIGGFFTAFNGILRSRIARLNANGSLDDSFNPGLGANNVLSSIGVQPDGKIVVGGIFTSYNGTSRNRIARLNSIGSLDETFNPGTGSNSQVLSIAFQSDGKIMLGGEILLYNGISVGNVACIFGYSGCTPPTIIGNNQLCNGGSTVLTSSALTGNLWSNGATTRSITVSAAGGYSVQNIVGGCTSARSTPISVNMIDCGHPFIGSGNYNVASNWLENVVPEFGSNIFVVGNMIVNANVSYSNIRVQGGGGISLNEGNTLTVTGNLTNAGTISGGGVLVMDGHNNQEFGGGRVSNLYINNNATVIQSSATLISGTLTLGNSLVLNLNNYRLTLLSNPIHTAQLAQVPPSSSISNAGNFTVQRWLNRRIVRTGTSSVGNFYFLGPVVQGQTMNLWNSQSPYNSQTFTGIGIGNLYLYNPTTDNWYKPSSSITVLPVGAGIQVWFGLNQFFNTREIWSVTGVPQVGDYNLPITAHRGFHLLSNPYPSTIDWDSPNWTKTNVYNAIYVYDWVHRRYKSYIDGVGTNGGNRYLPTAQGFLVWAENNSPVLTARESIKVSNQVALQRTESQVNSIIRLQVQKGSMTDEVVIAHRPNTHLAFEPQADAQKMMNPATNIFVGGAVPQSIASMDFNAAIVIPIALLSDSTGMVTMSTTEFSGLSGGTFYLVDEVTTEVYPYTPQTTYQFYLNANEPYSLSLRLNNVNGVNSFKANIFEVFPNPATDKVTIKTTGIGTLQVLNMFGQVVFAQKAKETNEIKVSNLLKGVYTVMFNGISQKLVIQ
jgi:uncharacterized delta-60 repeat protein